MWEIPRMTTDPWYLAGHERQTVGDTLNISIKGTLVTLDMHANCFLGSFGQLLGNTIIKMLYIHLLSAGSALSVRLEL